MSKFTFAIERASAYVGGTYFYPSREKKVQVIVKRRGCRNVKSTVRQLEKVTL